MNDADADLLQALVAIPSETGSEAAAVRFMQERARADGLRVTEDAVGNFIADVGHGPRTLHFVGHIDTVPGHIPVRVEEGTLWGRGAVDAKGPLAAAYCAARRFVGSSAITIRVVGAVDEEGNSRGAKALATEPAPDWIVVGEPSGVHGLTIGYKGIVRGTIRLERPRHHGAHPGPTAVEAMVDLWGAAKGTFGFDDTFDAVQGHLTTMDTASDGLVDRVSARFNIRLPPGVGTDDAERRLADLAASHDATVHVDERVEPALAPKRTDLMAAFLTAIRQAGGTPRLLRKTGTCDLNLLARRHPGVPILAYGPGDARLDHTPEERLDLAEFGEAVEILSQVFGALAKRGPGLVAAAPAALAPRQGP